MSTALGIVILLALFGTVAYFMAQDIGWKWTAVVWVSSLTATALMILAVFLIVDVR